jgi:hypothetical protein
MGLRSILSRLSKWFSPAPTPAPRRTPLRLETLEARDVPAVAINDTYLAGLYQGFLGRVIDTNGLAFWRTQLAITGSRITVAEDIVHSQEYHGRELQLLYGTFLQRSLDNAGLRFWGNVLETGGTYEQVKAGILGSQEFFIDKGNTFPNWLTAVYQSQLNRTPSPADLAFWTSQFNSLASLQTIASQILASHEFHIVEMNSLYPLILGRPLDTAGSSFWGGVLDSGVSVDDVAANLVGSQEFINNQTVFLATNNFDDVNLAANGFFNANGLFSRVLPGVEQLNRFIPSDPTIRTAAINGPVAGTVLPVNVTPSNVTVGPITAGASPSLFTSPFATGTNSATVFGGTNGVMTGANSGTLTGTNSGTLTGANSGTLTGTNSGIVANSGLITGSNSATLTGANSGTLTGMNSTAVTGLNSAPSSFFV